MKPRLIISLYFFLISNLPKASFSYFLKSWASNSSGIILKSPAIRIFGVIDDGSDATYCPVEIRGARKNTGGNTGTSGMGADRGVVRISNDGDNTVATFTGEGLCFHSDTAAANALDDYEEGTFTPTARGNNTNSSPVIEGSGKYTKIGNVVQIQLSFANENGSYLPSGEYIQIHGLPFTFNGEHFIPYGFNYKVVYNSSYQYLFYSPSGNTRLDGYINVSDSPYTPWGTDQWDNTQWYHSNSFSYLTS